MKIFGCLTSVATAALLLFSSSAAALEGKVIGVMDGDTIEVLTDGLQTHRVRMASIDAPEKGMPFGQAAKTYLKDLLLGKRVSVTEDSTDRYGRTVGLVVREGLNINEVMVKDGFAWAYCDEPAAFLTCRYLNKRDARFVMMQADAQRRQLGLWSQPVVTPPWEWRNGRRDRDNLLNARCSSFKTCDEAREALAAGNMQIDGDRDGIPCDSLCKSSR